jgi:hypothetical protein
MGRGSARLAVQQHAALIRTIFLRGKAWVFQEPRPTKKVLLCPSLNCYPHPEPSVYRLFTFHLSLFTSQLTLTARARF